MQIRKNWIDHLRDNNMYYGEHFMFAIKISIQCLVASIKLLIHAVFPCWFQTTGRSLMEELKKSFHEA